MDSEHDNNSDWVQHKQNPYILHNTITSHFRCKKCRMDMGVNAGGAASHSQGAHNIRLDGTQIIKKIEPVKIVPKPIESHELIEKKTNIMLNETNIVEQRTEYMEVIPKYEPEDDPYYHLHKKIDRLQEISILYKKARMAGISRCVLRPLEVELGISDEEEERKKRKEKHDKEIENQKTVFWMLAARDNESKRRLFCYYLFKKYFQNKN